MNSFAWIDRPAAISHDEFVRALQQAGSSRETDLELASSEFGNLLHLADSHNHFYWLQHSSNRPVPISFTQQGVHVPLIDDEVLAFARELARILMANVRVNSVRRKLFVGRQ